MKQPKKLSESEKKVKRTKLRTLINEIYTLSTDPYLKVNYIGKIQCKLCHTQHNTEASYIVHRNSKKHILLSEKKINEKQTLKFPPKYKIYYVKRRFNKKEYLSDNNTIEKYKIGYLIEIRTPLEIKYKIIDSTQQSVEQPNLNYNYLVIKTYSHDNIGIRVPKKEYDILKWFDGHTYKLQILFDEII